MQKLLVKLFIKDYKNTSDIKVRSKYGTLSGVVGIITNLLLCTLKITLGIITASQSILADGINNLTDAGSSIITLVGFKLSSAPPDKDHPYGHERIEYVTGLLISIIIFIPDITINTATRIPIALSIQTILKSLNRIKPIITEAVEMQSLRLSFELAINESESISLAIFR
mgnify:CR=1 FL=1